MLSSTDRISVGGKSPLTSGIKESNAGGRTCPMASAGCPRAIFRPGISRMDEISGETLRDFILSRGKSGDSSLETVGRLNWEVNDLGLDSI